MESGEYEYFNEIDKNIKDLLEIARLLRNEMERFK